jgi:Arc/MetJ family transcription regulator
MPMATNLQIDDQLITRAVKLGRHRTKKGAVTQALTEYIQHLEQEKVLSMFGSVDYVPDYNYKTQRAKA